MPLNLFLALPITIVQCPDDVLNRHRESLTIPFYYTTAKAGGLCFIGFIVGKMYKTGAVNVLVVLL